MYKKKTGRRRIRNRKNIEKTGKEEYENRKTFIRKQGNLNDAQEITPV